VPQTSSSYRDVVTVGASAGGARALTELVRGLPAELPASLLVAQHTSPAAPAVLPVILSRAGRLPASAAVDGEPLERGHIYVAPPDHHLLVGDDRLIVTRGPRENGHRPAVDPLFRSAARHYGPRVVAVVLSGTLDDGTAGLTAVKARGGTTIVQEPTDALHRGMPENAIEGDHPDYVAPAAELADLLRKLARRRRGDSPGLARRYEACARACEEQAEAVQTAIQQLGSKAVDRPRVL
jgi:two-component system chemotaxis response regulator CheB